MKHLHIAYCSRSFFYKVTGIVPLCLKQGLAFTNSMLLVNGKDLLSPSIHSEWRHVRVQRVSWIALVANQIKFRLTFLYQHLTTTRCVGGGYSI